MVYPDSFEQKISFDAIRQILKDKCVSTLGMDKVDDIRFLTDYEKIIHLLQLTDEMKRLLTQSSEELPFGSFFDIRNQLSRVNVEGLFLEETEIFNLRQSLDTTQKLVHFLAKQDSEQYPYLHELIGGIQSFDSVIKKIDNILDKYGKIKDQASVELLSIRKNIFQVQGSISKTLHSILRQAQRDGYVEKDVAPTMREGRLVIPVSPAFKRKINGIVHDESATGKTIYIEPQQVVEANNRVRELESEERREIIRILKEFTDFLRPHFQEIIDSQYFLGEIDFLRSKVLFAIEINAIFPRIDNCCQLEWSKAVHPLLFLNLKKQQKEIVPLDIVLNEKQRILVISGPNAGGKSVCLKTVALLQYMLQCGILVPIHESSRAGIFQHIFIDIGDEQSIENDLSTYSSHLLNMKYFIKNCNEKTLLLIDEFGSGTEPQIGGAIAEACLERFNEKKAFGVITTHYTNLKHFAQDTEGIVNGAMLYDRQHLQPLFILQIGNPGSSFAVEIARKIGLPEDVIAEAAQKAGTEQLDYDKYLLEIARDKRYWERKREEIHQKEKRLDESLRKYEEELKTTDFQRKEILNKSKQQAENLLKEANAKIENTIKTIRESQAEKEKTRIIRQELENFKKDIASNFNQPELSKKTVHNSSKKKQPPKSFIQKEKISENNNLSEKTTFQINQSVRIKGQSAIGFILDINDKQAVVAFGQMKTTAKVSDLEMVSNNEKRNLKRKNENSFQTITDEIRDRKLNFKSEIDVRGMRADDALQAVTYFIDDALMVGISRVRILHGKGNGILLQLIRQYLGTVSGIKSFHDEHVQFGGSGITVVEFE